VKYYCCFLQYSIRVEVLIPVPGHSFALEIRIRRKYAAEDGTEPGHRLVQDNRKEYIHKPFDLYGISVFWIQ
jgi:hypothetical protein